MPHTSCYLNASCSECHVVLVSDLHDGVVLPLEVRGDGALHGRGQLGQQQGVVVVVVAAAVAEVVLLLLLLL